jgi:hypothetical protein
VRQRAIDAAVDQEQVAQVFGELQARAEAHVFVTIQNTVVEAALQAREEKDGETVRRDAGQTCGGSDAEKSN